MLPSPSGVLLRRAAPPAFFRATGTDGSSAVPRKSSPIGQKARPCAHRAEMLPRTARTLEAGAPSTDGPADPICASENGSSCQEYTQLPCSMQERNHGPETILGPGKTHGIHPLPLHVLTDWDRFRIWYRNQNARWTPNQCVYAGTPRASTALRMVRSSFSVNVKAAALAFSCTCLSSRAPTMADVMPC